VVDGSPHRVRVRSRRNDHRAGRAFTTSTSRSLAEHQKLATKNYGVLRLRRGSADGRTPVWVQSRQMVEWLGPNLWASVLVLARLPAIPTARLDAPSITRRRDSGIPSVRSNRESGLPTPRNRWVGSLRRQRSTVNRPMPIRTPISMSPSPAARTIRTRKARGARRGFPRTHRRSMTRSTGLRTTDGATRARPHRLRSVRARPAEATT
jgi:hypothetical protein